MLPVDAAGPVDATFPASDPDATFPAFDPSFATDAAGSTGVTDDCCGVACVVDVAPLSPSFGAPSTSSATPFPTSAFTSTSASSSSSSSSPSPSSARASPAAFLFASKIVITVFPDITSALFFISSLVNFSFSFSFSIISLIIFLLS